MSYQRSPAQTFEPEQAPLDAQLTQPTSPLLGLQRQLGNAAVQDLIRSQQAGPASAAPSTDRQPSWWDRAVDWAGEQADEQIDFGASLVAGVPVLGAAASGIAAAEHFAVDAAAGFARGAGDLVGGLGHMVAHPLETAQSVGAMASHIPGTQLWLLNHFGPSNAEDTHSADPKRDDSSPRDNGALAEDGAYWSEACSALIEPYKRSIDEGKPGEAIGRGFFDLGALFVGAGELKATGKAADMAEVLATAAKADEPLKALNTLEQGASTANDLARAGNKTEAWTKPASTLDEAAELGRGEPHPSLSASEDEARRMSDAANAESATTRLEGETPARPEALEAPRAEDLASGRQPADPPGGFAEEGPVTRVLPTPDEVRGSSPIAIPPEATIVQQAKAAGYDQIRFRWDDGVARYDARWHTRTPGAPLEQGDTWVVERKIHGGPNGQQKALQILTGEDQWVSKMTWTEAINARKAGIATPEQNALLAAGHHPG